MSKRLNSGDTVTVAAVTEIIRPATKRLNRISDLNVCAITTGQLRWGANTMTGGVPSSPANPEQNGSSSYDLIPNTSSIQLLAYDNTAGIDLLEKIKEDLSYIDAMVV